MNCHLYFDEEKEERVLGGERVEGHFHFSLSLLHTGDLRRQGLLRELSRQKEVPAEEKVSTAIIEVLGRSIHLNAQFLFNCQSSPRYDFPAF